jgi:hypothetical protein
MALACNDNSSPRLASLLIAPDSSLHFAVIGDTVHLAVRAVDPEGETLRPTALSFASRNEDVARVDGEGRVESMGEGVTYVVVEAAGLRESVSVSVAQARDSLVVAVRASGRIVSIPGGTAIPLSCRVFDAAGTKLATPVVVTSRNGTLAGSTCDNVIPNRSGHDTLDLTAGSYQTALPLVVAIRPVVLTDPSLPVEIDSVPEGLTPWAPTIVKASNGEYNLYFAGYTQTAGQLGGRRGSLHRLVSADGTHYRYDGIALQRDDYPCEPRGTGIENVAIVPRMDASGWRMFYAAGSNDCGGWQVFSAVSRDEKTWSLEPGVRIPNGGRPDESAPMYPSGEGMDITQLPDGTWRMLVGAYERVEPRENRFQITEWRSADQLTWTYRSAVLTTRQVGPEVNRSIYSPTVQELAPGLRRMYFSGDNLKISAGASRIYSAVSVNGSDWEVEGVVLGGEEADYFYASVVDDLLVFIRSVSGVHALGAVRIRSQ